MKRTFSIVMLLIANVILLTHSTIPHHHHDKVAVAIVYFGEEETEHHHAHNGESHHHHGHDSDGHHHDGPESCFLTETLEEAVVPDTSLEIAAPLNSSHLLQHLLPAWEAVIIEAASAVDALQYLRHPFRVRPYFTSVYLAFVESRSGFRAPPFC